MPVTVVSCGKSLSAPVGRLDKALRVATAFDTDRVVAKRMLNYLRVGCFCLALVPMANAVGAADRVPAAPRITVTVPKPPVVNRPSVPSSRIPIRPPSGAGSGRDAPQVQIPARRRARVPLPSDGAAGIPARASPKAPEALAQKTGPGKAPTVSGGGGLEGATATGGGGLSSFPTAGGGGFDTQALVRTGQ